MKLFSSLFGSRETSQDRAQWVQSAVHSAATQLENQMRGDLRRAARSFETAETPAWTDSWPTHGGELNDDLARQLPAMRNRSLGLARNNEWATSYLKKLDDNILGTEGIRLQMRLKLSDGSADKATNKAIEDAVTQWCERGNCEVTGRRTWRQVESLAVSSLARTGELLYRFRPGGGAFGFRIQLLPSTLVDVNLRRDWQGRRVRMGVEIDDDNAPVAYWLKAAKSAESTGDLVSVGKHVRIPADQIRHCFIEDEIDQLRGVPWLSVGAQRLWLLNDFDKAAAVATSNAAKRQGFFVSPDGEAPPGFGDTIKSAVLDRARAEGRTLSLEELQTLDAATQRYTTTMPGQYDTLPNGYDFRPFESKWPNIEAGPYQKQQVRTWAAARGLSYVTLGNDLEAVNYSSARVGILDEREHYKTLQAFLIRSLHAEVINEALRYIVLRTPSLRMSRLAEYRAAATWQPRRWAGIDPVKEANANETNLRLRLTSRRRIQLEQGIDPDEVRAEIEEEEALYGPLDPENTPAPAVDGVAPAKPAAAPKRNAHLAAVTGREAA